MREAHGRIGVERVQHRTTRKAQFAVAAIDRLATTASASRRTGHHFDEVVIHRARIERRDQLVKRSPAHARPRSGSASLPSRTPLPSRGLRRQERTRSQWVRGSSR